MRWWKTIRWCLTVWLPILAIVSGHGFVGVADAARIEPAGGSGAHVFEQPAGAEAVLQATARAIRPATDPEGATFGALARTSPVLDAARARLAPLLIDTAHPRFVGTTVGLIGVYYPIRGAIDGPASQYALWFDTATGGVTGEAEFVHNEAGVRVRIAVAGEVVMDEIVDGATPAQGGDFWSCFRWCVGESLSSEVYAIIRAVCGRLCFPVPSFFCDKCMIALGILEAGMITGCTYTCMNG